MSYKNLHVRKIEIIFTSIGEPEQQLWSDFRKNLLPKGVIVQPFLFGQARRGVF